MGTDEVERPRLREEHGHGLWLPLEKALWLSTEAEAAQRVAGIGRHSGSRLGMRT